MLDWELVHYGDPMADLAMLCLRMLFQGFVPLPQAFAAYEAAGGHPVDLARLRYWRLLFQTGFARRSRYDDPDAPPPPNLGMNLVYSTIHRRVLSEALADAAGVRLHGRRASRRAAGRARQELRDRARRHQGHHRPAPRRPAGGGEGEGHGAPHQMVARDRTLRARFPRR
ncbi:hypothetical protein [Sphingopyxis sp. PET50]|uniref:hypothetical protein n=1 Tax=Sphingopyxis sp. PET50 TaxID=2976533 RepID=UPI0021B00087|nr:hypothetical protein [Sphingopyxis sp. PET50]